MTWNAASGLLIYLALGAWALQTPAAPKAPKDFALRLEYGCSGREIIDTAAGTYAISYRHDFETVPVRVPAKLKDQFFGFLQEARFFEMSSRVSGLRVCEPSAEYRLQVRTNGETTIVSWSDCSSSPKIESIDPKAAEPYRINALFNAIIKPFDEMASVKNLRKRRNWACL